MQSTLAYSRKLVALGRLTAGIAHEVKNPLNAMMIHLELLRTKIRGTAVALQPQAVAAAGAGMLGSRVRAGPRRSRRPSKARSSTSKSSRARFGGWTRSCRDSSSSRGPRTCGSQPVKVQELLDEILPIIEPEAQQEQREGDRWTASRRCRRSTAMSAMLRQAFLNLAINACQAMPSGGSLRLTSSPVSRQRVEVRVQDTGVGIAPEHLSKIFDLYFTTKDHGTGIGLSMVYRIIQMHDGEVEVQSTPGRGTTFRVLLPRASGI